MKLRSHPGLEPLEDDASSAIPARRKGTLVCPGCGHESHVDGDWIHRESPEATRYDCPACGCVVVSQPAFHGPDPA